MGIEEAKKISARIAAQLMGLAGHLFPDRLGLTVDTGNSLPDSRRITDALSRVFPGLGPGSGFCFLRFTCLSANVPGVSGRNRPA